MANKFRIGGVAAALSEGLGKLAETAYRREIEEDRRRWEMHMQAVADARAKARDDVEFQRNLALQIRETELRRQEQEAEREYRTDEREAGQRFTSMENDKTRAAAKQQNFWKYESEQRKYLTERIEALREAEKDELENPEIKYNKELREKLKGEYAKERERIAGRWALHMMDQADQFPDVEAFGRYRAGNADEVQGIFETAGMSPAAAARRAEDVWKYRSPVEPFGGAGAGGDSEWTGTPLRDQPPYQGPQQGPQPGAPRAPEPGASRGAPINQPAMTLPEQAPAAQPRYAADPRPMAPGQGGVEPLWPGLPPEQPAQAPDLSLRGIFQNEPVMDRSGKPKYPANRDALMYKLGDLFNTEIPYGQ